MLLAILICLENSFWFAEQKTSAIDGFLLALDSYSTKQMNEIVISQCSNNWFDMEEYPSDEELIKFQQIVLENLLCKFYFFFLNV
jgi:hypothetical protein